MTTESILTIMHTNDLHSHLENWPRIRRYLLDQQRNLKDGLNDVLTFDIGDALDRVHPLTEATLGTANVALMNQANYDAVTIGNNEGLSLHADQLNQLYDAANFPVLVANFFDAKTDELPAWNQAVHYQKTADGTKIGIIGLTAKFDDSYPLLGWNVTAVGATLDKILPTVRANSDVVILLSHLGLNVDRRIAQRFSDIDIILGAHTHHLLEHGEMVNGTLLAAAGKWGRWIGKISVRLRDHKIVTKTARVIQTDELPELPADLLEIAGYVEAGQQQLRADKIADLPKPLLRSDRSLIDDALAMLKEKTGVPAAMLSTGLFLRDLPAGIVNRNDLLELLPHQMHVMTTTLSGVELKRLMQEVHKNGGFLRGFSLVGVGFRGKIFGELDFAGLAYDERLDQVYYDNEPITPTGEYVLASLDYYKFIPFLPTIEIAGVNEIMMNNNLREDYAAYLAKHYRLAVNVKE